MTETRLSEGTATPGILVGAPVGPPWLMDNAISGPEKDCMRGLFYGSQWNGCTFSSSRLVFLPVLWISYPFLLRVSLPYQIAPFPLTFKLYFLVKFNSNVWFLKNLSGLSSPLPNLPYAWWDAPPTRPLWYGVHSSLRAFVTILSRPIPVWGWRFYFDFCILEAY